MRTKRNKANQYLGLESIPRADRVLPLRKMLRIVPWIEDIWISSAEAEAWYEYLDSCCASIIGDITSAQTYTKGTGVICAGIYTMYTWIIQTTSLLGFLFLFGAAFEVIRES